MIMMGSRAVLTSMYVASTWWTPLTLSLRDYGCLTCVHLFKGETYVVNALVGFYMQTLHQTRSRSSALGSLESLVPIQVVSLLNKVVKKVFG